MSCQLETNQARCCEPVSGFPDKSASRPPKRCTMKVECFCRLLACGLRRLRHHGHHALVSCTKKGRRRRLLSAAEQATDSQRHVCNRLPCKSPHPNESTSQNFSGQGRAGQGRAGQGRAGQRERKASLPLSCCRIRTHNHMHKHPHSHGHVSWSSSRTLLKRSVSAHRRPAPPATKLFRGFVPWP